MTRRLHPGLRLFSSAILIAPAICAPSIAAQQGADPKPEYYIGEGEVDLSTGVYSYTNTDLHIGPSDAEGGLTYTRLAGVRRKGVAGPTIGHSLEAMLLRERYKYDPQGEGIFNYRFHVVLGRMNANFNKDYSGTIDPMDPRFGTLSWSSDDGPYVYTARDGTVVNFAAGTSACIALLFRTAFCGAGVKVTRPNGVVLDYAYQVVAGAQSVRLITTNRGFGMGFEYDGSGRVTKVCALNLAQTYVTASAPCPSGVRSTTYTYSSNSQGVLTSSTFTDAVGNTTTYTYDGEGNILTIKAAGSSAPDLTVGYGYRNAVTSLTYGNGSAWTYTYENGSDPDDPINEWTKVKDPLNNETRHNLWGDRPSSVVDPLGRTTRYRYVIDRSPSLLAAKVDPELNEVRYTYDGLDHPTETRRVAKPGSGLSDIVTTATYSTGCITAPTCDKPLTTTDARGNTTTYTYASHGGVLTETLPAVGGISPVKRYTYAQRYAWLKASGSGYVQAATPIWLLTEERTCRTTATSGSACAGGTADEIVTAYDYGSNSGPNNLLLRGVTVTADGQTLRTCYGYDAYGQRISETKPRAVLSSCP